MGTSKQTIYNPKTSGGTSLPLADPPGSEERADFPPVRSSLTNSSRCCFQRCAREYQYRYELGIRPRRTEDALRFGSLIHLALEAWMSTSTRRLYSALEAIRAEALTEDLDEYDVVKAECLMIGYHYRWIDDQDEWEVLGVEESFGGVLADKWQLRGKVDVILRQKGDSDRYIMEHKTTSQDITPGSPYLERLRLDSQVSIYYHGITQATSYPIVGCIYDIIKKPTIKPYRATPEEKLRYKKDGSLYASCRLHDESPQDYGKRVAEDIEANPDKYYRRVHVPRLDGEVMEAIRDCASVALHIDMCRYNHTWPRNPDSCHRYGRFCCYWPVCTGETSIDDTLRYEEVEHVHPELEGNR